MNKNKYFSVLIILIILLSGCSTGTGFLNTNTPEDAGKKPILYEETIRQYLKNNLKDPNSLIDFSVSEPILTSCAVGIYGPFYGWRVTTQYNAKNSYGGYVGLQTFYYWFHGEKLKGIGKQSNFCSEAPSWR